jgi:3-oxoadipate enol-lactonase
VPKAVVNGVELNYEEAGEGPPLLLISGLGANRNAWATVVPVLSQQYRVITFDNRGTGQSEVPPGPYSMSDLAADTAALIDHLGIGPVPVVGWSMGGVILQALMVEHPGKVSRAVLLSTFPSYTYVQHAWLDGLLALREQKVSPQVLATASLPWGFTGFALSNHDAVKAMLELGAQDPEPTSTEGFAAQAHGIRRFNITEQLRTIKNVPTLVLVGAEDILTPPAQAIEMAQNIEGAELVILPRGSHGMVVEFGGAVVPVIQEFLAR